MKKWIPILLIAFLIWGFVSWNWYVCGVHQACNSEAITNVPVSDTKEPNKEVASSTPVVATGDLESKHGVLDVLTNETTATYLNSIKSQLGDGKELVITGAYFGDESAPEGFKNMGLARAMQIKASLHPDVDTSKVKISSALIGESKTPVNGLFKSVNLAVNTIGVKEDFAVQEFGDKIIINFPTASAVPGTSAAVNASINKLASLAKSNGSKLSVSGHTDNTGNPESNIFYGKQRADAIAAILMQQGISKEQLIVTSKGETQPIQSNDTKEGKRQNRRVEIKIIK